MSDLRRLPLMGTSTRKRYPMRWSAERSSSSGFVLRLFVLLIRARMTLLDAGGTPLRDRLAVPLRDALDVDSTGSDSSDAVMAHSSGSTRCTPSSGGTALPITVAHAPRPLLASTSKKSGNVWRRAASWGVRVRARDGWTKRPCPIEPKPVVIVGAGSVHSRRPYMAL